VSLEVDPKLRARLQLLIGMPRRQQTFVRRRWKLAWLKGLQDRWERKTAAAAVSPAAQRAANRRAEAQLVKERKAAALAARQRASCARRRGPRSWGDAMWAADDVD
jgi:hypothetical protein